MSDAPSAFQQVTRTARKVHNCCECRRQIVVGEKYVYSSGIWEREPFGFKQCLICAEVSNAAAAITDDYDDKPTFSGLKDWFANQVCREFKGDEFVAVFARVMQLSPEKIWHVLGREFFDG